MTCRSIQGGTRLGTAIMAMGFLHVSRAAAQSPATGMPSPTTVPAPAPPALALYRTPVIALVQPAAGGTVPQDKPVVVFRFAQGEANDGIDAKSFFVTIDGVDVTPAFQIAGGDAWGSLAGTPGAGPVGSLTVGVHEVTARICSERGACGTATAAVTILALPQVSAAGPSTHATSKRGRIVDLIIRASKKLLLP